MGEEHVRRHRGVGDTTAVVKGSERMGVNPRPSRAWRRAAYLQSRSTPFPGPLRQLQFSGLRYQWVSKDEKAIESSRNHNTTVLRYLVLLYQIYVA